MSVDEWDTREVCADGACTGVIGDDGRCKVCGTISPTWDNERERGLAVDDGEADDDDDDYEDDDEEGDEDDNDDVASGDGEWDQRTLCPDGACTGVLNDARVCSVCGKTWPA